MVCKVSLCAEHTVNPAGAISPTGGDSEETVGEADN